MLARISIRAIPRSERGAVLCTLQVRPAELSAMRLASADLATMDFQRLLERLAQEWPQVKAARASFGVMALGIVAIVGVLTWFVTSIIYST